LGSACSRRGCSACSFHYVGQRDAEEQHIQRIRDVIADDLAARPDGLVTLVSSETRDRIVENCLRVQFDDEALAHDLYADLRDPIGAHRGATLRHGPICGAGAVGGRSVMGAWRDVRRHHPDHIPREVGGSGHALRLRF
jgi:hypothetical protein